MAHFGDFGLKKQPGAVYAVQKNGLATYDKTMRGRVTEAMSFRQGDTPDEHPNTVLLSMSFTETGDDCDILEAKLHYEGYDDSLTIERVREDSSLDITSSSEPIETHPDFINFAGYLNNVVNAAKFRIDGSFDFFMHDVPAPGGGDGKVLNKFAGVQSYLYPRQTFTTNKIEESWPSQNEMNVLGKIVELSEYVSTNPPKAPTGSNWLYSGSRIRNIGNTYFETQRVFALSGPRGWIRQIYSTEPPPWEGDA